MQVMDVDLDRTVWDPDYRRDVMALLNQDKGAQRRRRYFRAYEAAEPSGRADLPGGGDRA